MSKEIRDGVTLAFCFLSLWAVAMGLVAVVFA
jgi:hypothetical protein